jgi:hypothetical protein
VSAFQGPPTRRPGPAAAPGTEFTFHGAKHEARLDRRAAFAVLVPDGKRIPNARQKTARKFYRELLGKNSNPRCSIPTARESKPGDQARFNPDNGVLPHRAALSST